MNSLENVRALHQIAIVEQPTTENITVSIMSNIERNVIKQTNLFQIESFGRMNGKKEREKESVKNLTVQFNNDF